MKLEESGMARKDPSFYSAIEQADDDGDVDDENLEVHIFMYL